MSGHRSVDDPRSVAAEIDALARPRLLVFDCDGVLAPIVAHAADARLADGNADALADLAALPGTIVAILSGRSLDGLAQFGFGNSIEVVGSYGAERRGLDHEGLDDDRRRLLDELTHLAAVAADDAGDGAWVEHKPASVVLHVREADPADAARAVRRVRDDAERLHGVFVHDGKAVVELAVHRSDKGSALGALVDEFEPSSVLYVGDDEPDEVAFAELAQRPIDGVTVRVGPPGPTGASRRLADPSAVTAVLRDLVARG